MKFLITAACWAALLLYSWLATAQAPRSNWHFAHLTVNEGLAHSDAVAVAQDLEGFIWVGTNRGLDRYDGQQLRNYSSRVDDAASLSSNRIRKLYVAPGDKLWVGTENGGLNYYNRNQDRFIRFDSTQLPRAYWSMARLLAHAYIKGIAADSWGNMWVGTQKQGVFVLKCDRQGHYTALHRVLTASYEVGDVQAGAGGSIWVGTNNGLYCMASQRNNMAVPILVKVVLPEAATPQIRSLYLDRHDNLWIGTHDRVYYLARPGTAARPVLAQAAKFPGLSSLLLDSFGQLWVGTEFGIYIIHPRGTTSLAALQRGSIEHLLPEEGVPASLSSGRIHQLVEDRFQVVWVATSAGGINRVDLLAKPFGHLSRQPGPQPTLPSSYINAIYKEEAQNLLWIATRNGFSKYDLGRHTYQNYLSQAAEVPAAQVDVSTIFQDSRGTLWFGTWQNGFVCLRREGGHERLTRYHAALAGTGLSSNSVIAFAEDRAGFIWVATSDAGLNQYSPEGRFIKAYTQHRSGLPTDLFCYLYYDRPANVMWASTHNAGLLKLQPGPDTLRVLDHFVHQPANPHSLAVNYLWPITPDHQGNLWLGSLGGGLHKLQRSAAGGRETIYRYGSRLSESDVESILEDEQGSLWIGGGSLLHFNPRTQHYQKFDVADGLQSNSFKVGAACRAADGTMYFGGINGINYFKPKDIRPNPYPPTVVITGLRVLNKAVGIGDTLNGRVLLPENLTQIPELTIKARENDFSLEFVGLHYANPGKNAYAYQLEGYQEDWVYPPVGQHSANFANLTPGTYRFRVKASNGDGLWSARPATLRLVVLPPWWKTWWAYCLYALTTMGLLFLLRRINTAQHELKNKLTLEQVAHEKNQEINELKLRFFTNVSHELRTPLTLILGPIEELVAQPGKSGGMRDKLLLMHRQTRKLLTLVNQLLDFRKAESAQLFLRAQLGDITLFAREIFLVFNAKAVERHIEYSFEAAPTELLLYFDHDKLEIVLSNLLTNAFKFTAPGGRIRVGLTVVGDAYGDAKYQGSILQDNYLQVCVVDSGVGMNSTELDKIFDIYYQATQTETMQVMGTGIGLSLVKQIVNCHHGEISVNSLPGVGTQFSIRLPLGWQHLLAEEIWVEPEKNNNSGEEGFVAEGLVSTNDVLALSTCRLLIVEDNEEVLQYLHQLFAPLFTVQLARDGAEGFALALTTQPDLVLSDVMMPHDGLELCRNIKQHAKTMHVPVILLTARAAAIQELEGVETGADDYVTKPFNPEMLQAKVVNLLHNRQQMREYYHRQIMLEPSPVLIPDEDRALLDKAMHIVEAQLKEPEFNVQALVREIGISQSVLYRRIKAITGQTVIDFIHDIRMRRAAQLLRDSQLRISEIAFQIGMESVKRFRKTFQKMYHMTPSEYAKKHHGIAREEEDLIPEATPLA